MMLNEIRCRGTLQSQWSTLTDSTSLKAEESVNVTDESRSSWYSSWNGTGGSSDDGGSWRRTRRSEWKRVGDSTILPLLRETSGRRELIAVWAERSETGCRLNAGDDSRSFRCLILSLRVKSSFYVTSASASMLVGTGSSIEHRIGCRLINWRRQCCRWWQSVNTCTELAMFCPILLLPRITFKMSTLCVVYNNNNLYSPKYMVDNQK